ncbi:hypothetical protein AAE021_01880 [Arthrobacter citreus]|uniref:Uncharacterized protein n=1 Tax=Arthrobacter citreus TaxID=1670 RepID=A0ABZ2ZW87_9MICC
MQRKSIAVALVLVAVSMPAAGCRSDSSVPSSPAPSSHASPATADPADSLTHTPGTDEPGAEYWTPERMESAVPYMPTDD